MDDVETHKVACLANWNQLKDEAVQKMRLFRAKQITRGELESWLKSQSAMDERTIRGMYNRMRGK